MTVLSDAVREGEVESPSLPGSDALTGREGKALGAAERIIPFGHSPNLHVHVREF